MPVKPCNSSEEHMSNTLYSAALTAFAKGEIVWKASGGSTVKAVIVDTANYTFSDAHTNLSQVPAAARVGSPVALTLVDAANGGVCDAADITFMGLTNAPTVEAIVLYKDTGTENTSTLIAYIDTGTGLPTPAGVNSIAVSWDNGANKIFKL